MHALTLFVIVGRKKRQPSDVWVPSCQHFVVWRHWQGDLMPYFTLWISEGFLLHCSFWWLYYANLSCYIDPVWFRYGHDSWSGLIWCRLVSFLVSFDQSLYDVAAILSLMFTAAFLWREMGRAPPSLLRSLHLMASLSLVIVQCRTETVRCGACPRPLSTSSMPDHQLHFIPHQSSLCSFRTKKKKGFCLTFSVPIKQRECSQVHVVIVFHLSFITKCLYNKRKNTQNNLFFQWQSEIHKFCSTIRFLKE